jgi:hypothetical protein
MVEILRHLLGLCGEHWHPNIFTISIFLLGGAEALLYIQYKLTNKNK